MKTKLRVLIVVFLTGMILGVGQPALLYGTETPGGNVWDQFVYTKPFKGTTVQGALSIYYQITGCETTNCPGDCAANMFYMVKLIKQNETITYLFQGSSQASHPDGICLKDILGQGAEIMNFFGNVVSDPSLFPNGVVDWKVTAIDNGQFNDENTFPSGSRAFVADVVITVKAKK